MEAPLFPWQPAAKESGEQSAEESVREWKGKRTTQKGRRKGGERSREDESKEQRDELGLILPPQSGAASDSICFKYMDRRVWAQDAMAGRDATRKRERERIQYPISYARTTPPDANVRQREEERKIDWSGGQEQDGERAPRYTTQLVSSVFPSFGSQYSNPLPLPNLPNESALRPTSSILPAARYRLPNNLTDCSAPATSGIRVLVSFQNLSEYPEILMKKEEERRRFVKNYVYYLFIYIFFFVFEGANVVE